MSCLFLCFPIFLNLFMLCVCVSLCLAPLLPILTHPLMLGLCFL